MLQVVQAIRGDRKSIKTGAARSRLILDNENCRLRACLPTGAVWPAFRHPAPAAELDVEAPGLGRPEEAC